MQWFQHDSDSTQDAKIKKLLIRHKAVGYAIYFHCLELISAEVSESNLTFELDHDAEIIASNLFIEGTADKSGIQVVEEVMRTIIDLGLFNEYNGHIFCMKLLKRINLSMTSNPSFRVAICKKKEEYHDTVMMRHDTVMLPTNQPTNQPTIPTIPTKKQKDFIPPSIDDVTNYVIEKKLVINPYTFFDYYSKLDWKDAQGNQVKSWKGKAVTWDGRDREKNPEAVPYTVHSKTSSIPDFEVECCGVKISRYRPFCIVCGKQFNMDGTIK